MNFDSHKIVNPHTYPLWIVVGIVIGIGALCIGLNDFAYYANLNQKMKKAERAFENKCYAAAGADFTELAALLPDNRHIKLCAASSLFKSTNNEDHQIALDHLKNITLSDDEWDDLLNYMPSQYVELFQDVKDVA